MTEMTAPPDEMVTTITHTELVATKFMLGRLINHCTGVYALPDAEVDEHKRDILAAVERMK